MSTVVAGFKKRAARILLGVAAASVLGLLLEGLAWFGLRIPNPFVPLLLVVLYCSYFKGWETGIASAAAVFFYCIYFFIEHPAALGIFESSALARLAVIAGSLSGAVALVTLFKQRSGNHRQESGPAPACEASLYSHDLRHGDSVEPENRLRTILDIEPECVKLLTADGTLLEINPAGLAMIEAESPAEVIGKQVLPLVDPAYREAFQKLTNRVFRGESGSLEFQIVGLKGTRRWLETHATPLRNGKGEITALLGITRDVTERREAEERLRESAEFSRQIIENSQEGIVVYSRDFRYAVWNSFMEKLTGVSPQQALGRKPTELFSFLEGLGLPQLFERALRGESCSLPDFPFVVDQTGRSGWASAKFSPLRDASGEIVGVIALVTDVSERREVEDALRKSEKHYRALIENSADAVALFSSEGKILYGSPATTRVLGYRLENFIGRNAFELVHPDDHATVNGKLIESLQRPGSKVPVSARVQHRDGSWRVLEGGFTNLLDDPDVGAIVNNYRDVTDRVKAEAAVHASEEKFARAFRSSPDAVTITTLHDGRYLDVNEAFLRLTGHAREEIIGKRTLEIGVWEDQTQRAAMLQRLQRDGRVERLETTFRKKNGEAIVVHLSAEVIDLDGASCLLAITRDVTEQKRAAEKLEHSEARYRALIENSPFGIYQSTLEGRFLSVNPALVSMLGYPSAAELLQLDLARDVYADPNERQRHLSLMLAGPPSAVETNWKRKDGRLITVRFLGRPVWERDGKLSCFEGFVENVTEERALAKQLQLAQKMEAVGQLAGGVAHDFNNLLMIIGSYAELILQGKFQPDRVQRQAQQILEASHRAANVTRQLLAFSRKQVLEPKVVDLNTLVEEMGRMIPRLIGENIETAILCTPNIGRVKVDPGQFEQVIVNLVVNARDAMVEGGRLTIETGLVELDRNYAEQHPSAIPGRYVQLSVSDTGVGMSAEVQSHIFEPFFTTKDRGRGTGLGLAMVYGIVKQSGGYIYVYSTPKLGTTFKIYLPLVEAPTAASGQRGTAVDPAPSGSETLLFVEDEAGLRAVGCEYLRARGYNVLEARHGKEALEICKKYRETIHVLVTDMVMPGMSGPEVAENALQLHPEMQVVYMSGYSDRALDPRVLGPHAAFLQKPFSMDVLARKLRSLLNQKQSAGV